MIVPIHMGRLACLIVRRSSGMIFNTIFVSSHMYPENSDGTQVIVGSMNMGNISDTARNQTHSLFRPKRESIPLGHSHGHMCPSHAYALVPL